MNRQYALTVGFVVALAAVYFLAFPRYEWRTDGARVLKIDHWTGKVTNIRPQPGQ